MYSLMKPLIFLIPFLLLPFILPGQDIVQGTVLEIGPGEESRGLQGANIYWESSQIGTMTDPSGQFSIPYSEQYHRLILSFVGFRSDTLLIDGPKTIRHILSRSYAWSSLRFSNKPNRKIQIPLLDRYYR